MQEFVTALNRLLAELKDIKALLQTLLKQTRTRLFKEEWVDGEDIFLSHHIQLRTLRNLRVSGKLPYSQLNDKYFYKYSDIRALLKKNYMQKKTKNHD
ncbi:MAG TPA: DNA-binding protein [Prolixibacteraceae bacterium]|jgi:hypothetical protein